MVFQTNNYWNETHVWTPLRVNCQLPKVPDHHCWQLSKNSFQFAQKQDDGEELRKQDVRCGQMSVGSSRRNSLPSTLFPPSTVTLDKELQYQEPDGKYQERTEVVQDNNHISSHLTTNSNIRTRQMRADSIMLYFHEWFEYFTLHGHNEIYGDTVKQR